MAPEFFDAKLIICITFPDKAGEVLMQVIGFKVWIQTGYCAPHDNEIKTGYAKTETVKVHIPRVTCIHVTPESIQHFTNSNFHIGADSSTNHIQLIHNCNKQVGFAIKSL
jgi:hypothetical protein